MHMFTSSACILAVATSLAAPALAGEGTFVALSGALAVGKVTTLSPGHVFWTGSLSGVIFDAAGGPMTHAQVTCPSMDDLDFNKGKAVIEGRCLISGGADSSIVATFTCSGAPGSCAGRATCSEGTGKWVGRTAADVTFTGQRGKALEDRSVPTYAVWTVACKTA
jgi:hypothetical protein